jgi:sulfur-carrier protein
LKVKVRAFASFREILGRELEVDLVEGSTIMGLLSELCSSRERLCQAIFDPSGQVRDYVVLMKNRKNIQSLEGFHTLLSEGDEVAIFPPVAGG